MAFQPILPLSGYAGWRFLARTEEAQRKAFATSTETRNLVEFFRSNVAEAKTADALVSDRRLLGVALGAFGLGEDINAKAFVKRVLDDGTLDPKALSNRLSDKRYAAFSKAMGFGDFSVANTQLSDFPDRITSRYLSEKFEEAVGESDPNLRLALGFERGLSDVLEAATSSKARWFTVMGTPALRTVFEGAFGLPSSFGSLDIDRQLEILEDKSEKLLGTKDLGEMNAEAHRETLIRNFLIRSETTQQSNFGSGQIALSLLTRA